MQSKVVDTKLPRDLGPIHFIGIGGIGMSGIAELLLNLGYTVSGSDLKNTQIIERLRGLGVTIQVGHNSSNITHAAIVVISSAINRDNIELIEARKRYIPVVRRSEMLAELMRLRSNIAIAGTHGKTTTTSMVAAVLEAGELDPTVINGGIIQAYGSNARLGAGDWMVVEADESDGTLVKIPTTIAVVTNLDPEHLEYYGSFNDLKETFLEFLDNIPFYGVGICCLDHPIVRSLISQTRDRRILTYGFNDRADFAIRDLHYSDQKARFDVYIKSQESKITLELPMYGDHNVSNATVAIAVASHLKISSSAMVAGLKNFKGVKRRFTKVCRWNGIDIIDDYAHHPVEIKAVLSAARQYSLGRVIVVHQPHRYSRLNSLMDDFCECFDEADIVGITPVYAAGELPIKGVSSANLVEKLGGKFDNVANIEDESGLRNFLQRQGKPGDIFVCLGAGSISQWVNRLPELLKVEI